MKYAVLKTGGKQYRVSEGQLLEVEKLDKKPKEKIDFTEVLLLVDDGDRQIGKPQVNGAKVEAEVLEQIKGPKIRVAKFKAKVRYRRVRGHRQSLTRVKIEKIVNGTKSSPKENVSKKEKAKAVPKKTVKKKLARKVSP